MSHDIPLLDASTGELIEVKVPAGHWEFACLSANGTTNLRSRAKLLPGARTDLGDLGRPVGRLVADWSSVDSQGLPDDLAKVQVNHGYTVVLSRTMRRGDLRTELDEIELAAGWHTLRVSFDGEKFIGHRYIGQGLMPCDLQVDDHMLLTGLIFDIGEPRSFAGAAVTLLNTSGDEVLRETLTSENAVGSFMLAVPRSVASPVTVVLTHKGERWESVATWHRKRDSVVNRLRKVEAPQPR